ncbi:hypothetical protein QYE76_026922 [Lolium multiflorum]|uniref:Uncharacterized protein n=1 Tax=Lolium multiflorum TaxID=4521 RepID=A0AAD8RH71_LOLMU|nr:hypothetical protein QYE76_026922 [Lolium multiflorum]
MWKTHAFKRALGPLLKQLDADYDIPADQISPTSFGGPFLQKLTIFEKGCDAEPADDTNIGFQKQSVFQTSTEENSSEGTQSSRRDSSSGNSEKTPQSQPDLPPSASKKRSAPEPADSQTPTKAGQGSLRTKSRCIKRARKEPQASPSNQEISNTDDTSSGEVEEVPMPSATLDLATSKSVADKVASLAKQTAETPEPITSSSDVPLVLGEGYDLSSLLTFDPESIEPATKTSEEPGPSTTHGQLQHLKALLSSSIETLVEDSEAVKSILEDIQPHLPVTLQVKLWS